MNALFCPHLQWLATFLYKAEEITKFPIEQKQSSYLSRFETFYAKSETCIALDYRIDYIIAIFIWSVGKSKQPYIYKFPWSYSQTILSKFDIHRNM